MEWIRDIPKKNHPAWPATNFFFWSHIWLDQIARTHSGELTQWFRDSSLNLLSPGQTELQYIHVHEEWQSFIENCLCFIQLGLLYEQKSCTYQKVVCNKFLQLERLCEWTFIYNKFWTYTSVKKKNMFEKNIRRLVSISHYQNLISAH